MPKVRGFQHAPQHFRQLDTLDDLRDACRMRRMFAQRQSNSDQVVVLKAGQEIYRGSAADALAWVQAL